MTAAHGTGRSVHLCVRVIDPQLDLDSVMWGDAAGGWQPPGVAWVSMLAAAGVPFTAGPAAAHDDGRGVLVYPAGGDSGPTRPTLVGPPPDTVEEMLGSLASVLGAVVVPDLRGVLVLRLDDPGAPVKRYLESWRHEDVSSEAWNRLFDVLADGGGRASVFCSPGWVRPDGTVSDSRVESPVEWAALGTGLDRGVIDLECHGHTHMHPDTEEWRQAPDRFVDERWFRELRPPRWDREPPAAAQAEILERWQRDVGVGTTLVAPGEAWGLNTVTAARDVGLQLFNSWGICRLQLAVPTWTLQIGSPYLDQPDPESMRSGLPVVGYWHDRDMALGGPDWVPRQLSAWRQVGARRLWSFAQLAHAYGPLEAVLESGEIRVVQAPAGVALRVIRG